MGFGNHNVKKDANWVPLGLVGNIGAGKRTILTSLKHFTGALLKEQPGIVRIDNELITLTTASFELGHNYPIDPSVWANFLIALFGCFFVVDSADPIALDKQKRILSKLLKEPLLDTKPFVVFLNKQDLPGAKSPEWIEKHWQLRNLFPSTVQYKVIPIHAVNNRGGDKETGYNNEGIDQGLRWLIAAVREDYAHLKVKNERDLCAQELIDQLTEELKKLGRSQRNAQLRGEIEDEIRRLQSFFAKNARPIDLEGDKREIYKSQQWLKNLNRRVKDAAAVDAKDNKELLLKDLQAIQEQYDQLKFQNEELKEEAEDARRTLRGLQEGMGAMDHVDREEADRMRMELDKARAQLDKARADLEAAKAEDDQTRALGENQQHMLDDLRAEIQRLKLECERLNAELDRANLNLADAMRKIETLENAVSSASQNAQHGLGENQKLADELASLREQLKASQETTSQLEAKCAQMESLRLLAQSSADGKSEMQKRLEDMTVKYQELLHEYNRTMSELLSEQRAPQDQAQPAVSVANDTEELVISVLESKLAELDDMYRSFVSERRQLKRDMAEHVVSIGADGSSLPEQGAANLKALQPKIDRAKQLDGQIDGLERDRDSIQKRIARLHAKTLADLDATRHELGSLKGALDFAKTELENKTAALRLSQEEAAYIQSLREMSVSELDDHIKELEHQMEELRRKGEEESMAGEEVRGKLSHARRELDHKVKMAQIIDDIRRQSHEQLKKQAKELSSQMQDKNAVLAMTEEQLRNVRQKAQAIEAELRKKEQEMANELASREEAIKAREEELKSAGTRTEELKRMAEQSRREIEDKEKRLAMTGEQLRYAQARADELQRLAMQSQEELDDRQRALATTIQLVESVKIEAKEREEKLLREAKEREDRLRVEAEGRVEALKLEAHARAEQLKKDADDRAERLRREAEEREQALRREAMDQAASLHAESEREVERLRREAAQQQERIRLEAHERELRLQREGADRAERLQREAAERQQQLQMQALEEQERLRREAAEREDTLRRDAEEERERVRRDGLANEERLRLEAIERAARIQKEAAEAADKMRQEASQREEAIQRDADQRAEALQLEAAHQAAKLQRDAAEQVERLRKEGAVREEQMKRDAQVRLDLLRIESAEREELLLREASIRAEDLRRLMAERELALKRDSDDRVAQLRTLMREREEQIREDSEKREEELRSLMAQREEALKVAATENEVHLRRLIVDKEQQLTKEAQEREAELRKEMREREAKMQREAAEEIRTVWQEASDRERDLMKQYDDMQQAYRTKLADTASRLQDKKKALVSKQFEWAANFLVGEATKNALLRAQSDNRNLDAQLQELRVRLSSVSKEKELSEASLRQEMFTLSTNFRARYKAALGKLWDVVRRLISSFTAEKMTIKKYIDDCRRSLLNDQHVLSRYIVDSMRSYQGNIRNLQAAMQQGVAQLEQEHAVNATLRQELAAHNGLLERERLKFQELIVQSFKNVNQAQDEKMSSIGASMLWAAGRVDGDMSISSGALGSGKRTLTPSFEITLNLAAALKPAVVSAVMEHSRGWAANNGLIDQAPGGPRVPPCCVHPSPWPHAAFVDARDIGPHLNYLFHAVSSDFAFVCTQLDGYARQDAFTDALLTIYKRVYAREPVQRMQMALMRSDYVLETTTATSPSMRLVRFHCGSRCAPCVESLTSRMHEYVVGQTGLMMYSNLLLPSNDLLNNLPGVIARAVRAFEKQQGLVSPTSPQHKLANYSRSLSALGIDNPTSLSLSAERLPPISARLQSTSVSPCGPQGSPGSPGPLPGISVGAAVGEDKWAGQVVKSFPNGEVPSWVYLYGRRLGRRYWNGRTLSPPKKRNKSFGAWEPSSGVLVVVPSYDHDPSEELWLEQLLWAQYHIRVLRRTLTQLASSATLEPESHSLKLEGMRVAVVYFKGGFSSEDYPSIREWDTRLLMEQSSAIKCPSIAMQLLQTRLMQHVVFNQPGVLERYGSETRRIRSMALNRFSFEPGHRNNPILAHALKYPNNYVLSSFDDSNNISITGEALSQALASLTPRELGSYLLTERIKSPMIYTHTLQNGTTHAAHLASILSVYTAFITDEGGEVLINESLGHTMFSRPADSDLRDAVYDTSDFTLLTSPYFTT